MADQPRVQVQLDPNGYYVTGVNIIHSEEEFAFFLTSQNQARQFLCSPKHAKRILMLLQQSIDQYESKFGKLETSLPQATTQTPEKKLGFDIRDDVVVDNKP